MKLPLVLAMSGASGACFGCRLLEILLADGWRIHLTLSSAALTVLQEEMGIHMRADALELERLLTTRPKWWETSRLDAALANLAGLQYHASHDFRSPIASGSARTHGMIVCPCSGGTLSGIARAASDNLTVRAADVHLKERRKLIVVPRETPLSRPQILNWEQLVLAGAIVLPAMPGWYHGVETPMDLVDFVVARILDHLDIEHALMRRWGDSR